MFFLFFFSPDERKKKHEKKKKKKEARYLPRTALSPFFSPPLLLPHPRTEQRRGKASSGIESICRPCYACENRAFRASLRARAAIVLRPTEIKKKSFLAPCQLCPDISVSFFRNKKTGFSWKRRRVVVAALLRQGVFYPPLHFFFRFWRRKGQQQLSLLATAGGGPDGAADACCSQSS